MNLLCRIFGHKEGKSEVGFSTTKIFCARCKDLMEVIPHPSTSPFASRQEVTSLIELKREDDREYSILDAIENAPKFREWEEPTHPAPTKTYHDDLLTQARSQYQSSPQAGKVQTAKEWLADDGDLVVHVTRYGSRWSIKPNWSTMRFKIVADKDEAVAIAKRVAANRSKMCRVKVAGQKGYLK